MIAQGRMCEEGEVGHVCVLMLMYRLKRGVGEDRGNRARFSNLGARWCGAG